MMKRVQRSRHPRFSASLLSFLSHGGASNFEPRYFKNVKCYQKLSDNKNVEKKKCYIFVVNNFLIAPQAFELHASKDNRL